MAKWLYLVPQHFEFCIQKATKPFIISAASIGDRIVSLSLIVSLAKILYHFNYQWNVKYKLPAHFSWFTKNKI